MQPAWSPVMPVTPLTPPQVFGARVEHGVEPELGELRKATDCGGS